MTWKVAQHCDCKLLHVEPQTKGSTPCLTPATRSLFCLFSNQPGDFGHKIMEVVLAEDVIPQYPLSQLYGCIPLK